MICIFFVFCWFLQFPVGGIAAQINVGSISVPLLLVLFTAADKLRHNIGKYHGKWNEKIDVWICNFVFWNSNFFFFDWKLWFSKLYIFCTNLTQHAEFVELFKSAWMATILDLKTFFKTIFFWKFKNFAKSSFPAKNKIYFRPYDGHYWKNYKFNLNK